MKIALIINKILKTKEENLTNIKRLTGEAVENGAKFVLFPETALTGLVNNGKPDHDLPLGDEPKGAVFIKLKALAKEFSIYLAIGLFERESETLCDSAFLFDPDGSVILKYRRISEGWLFPFARTFEDNSFNQQKWDSDEERGDYINQVKKYGATTLMVNYLTDKENERFFGGAWVVSASGDLLAEYPLGKEGILYHDLCS